MSAMTRHPVSVAAAVRAGATTARKLLLGGLFGQLFGLFVQLAPAGGDERGPQALRDRLPRDHALGDVAPGRKLEHDVEQRRLDDRAETAGAGLPVERLVGDLPERLLREDELDVVVAEEALVLLDEGVLRLVEDPDEVLAGQLVHRGDDR